MNATVAAVHGLTKTYGGVAALDGISLNLTENVVHGLLGRNGAGKSTLLAVLSGRILATSGRVEVFGRDPYERADVLSRTCFVREGQIYPEGFRIPHVLRAARLFYPNWDADFARRLCEAFELPVGRRVDRLSRGQHSAVGVVLGLAARAPLTLFDEPYLGLDAVARQRFYDQLLTDVAEHPRTVVLSTHLIDEVADLLERVILIDHGRLVLDQDAESLRQDAVSLTGPADAVRAAADGLVVLHRQQLGGVSRLVVRTGGRDPHATAGPTVRVEPVSLQRLMVHLSGLPTPDDPAAGPDAAPGSDAAGARVSSTNGPSR